MKRFVLTEVGMKGKVLQAGPLSPLIAATITMTSITLVIAVQ